ncbi:unnamed protein product, partial [Dibothriocephalus latus]
GIVGYSVPEGVRGGGFGSNGRPGLDQFDFRDTVNDRFSAMQTSHAGEGLGKLVDNIAYLGNVTRDVEVSPGSHFVGWDSGYNGRRTSVQLRFKFDAGNPFFSLFFIVPVFYYPRNYLTCASTHVQLRACMRF